MREAPDNNDDVIDSRDVIARIDELESELTDAFNEVSAERLEELGDQLTEAYEDRHDEDEEGRPNFGEFLLLVEGNPDDLYHHEAREYHGRLRGVFDTLEDFLEEACGDSQHLMHEEAEEYRKLKALAEQCEGYGDWSYGETLIRDSYFKDYAQELAEDVGAVKSDAGWPNNCIDWEQAARELKQDYTEVDFDGVTFYMRS